MTRNRATAGPNLESMLRLEIFEERAVPAHVGLHGHADVDHGHSDVEHGHRAHEAEGWATVEAHHATADNRLKAWLSEDSLYVDGPGHADDSPVHQKKAERAEFNNHGSLAGLDDTLTSWISAKVKHNNDRDDDTPKSAKLNSKHSGDDETAKSATASSKHAADDETPSPIKVKAKDRDNSDSPSTTPVSQAVEQPIETKPVKEKGSSRKPVEVELVDDDSDPIFVTILPVEAHPVEHTHPAAHNEPASEVLLVAPVPAEGNAATASTAATAHLAQQGETRADAPIAGQRPATGVPDLSIAAGDVAAPMAGDVSSAVEVAADAATLAVIPAGYELKAWAPAMTQVADLVSRFVPLDPNSVEQSVDQFLAQLRQARDLALTPRQAGLLTVAVFAGLAGGEVARRQRLPQRVSQILSRSKFFSGTKTA